MVPFINAAYLNKENICLLCHPFNDLFPIHEYFVGKLKQLDICFIPINLSSFCKLIEMVPCVWTIKAAFTIHWISEASGLKALYVWNYSHSLS